MPFIQGPGSWSLPGATIKLPELGLTEKLGGNKTSLDQAQRSAGMYGYSKVPTANYTPAGSKSPNTTLISNSNKTITNSSSSKNSSGSNSSNKSNSGDEDQYLKQQMDELNNVYDDALGYINQARGNLSNSYGDLMNIATSPFQQAQANVQNAMQEGVGKLKGFIDTTQKTGQSAFDDARRLYGELNQRNLNQFGSGALSSSGQAASELLGREQFRQFGNIGQQITNTVQDINQRIFDIERKAETDINNLKLQEGEAKSRAEIEFRNQMARLDEEERATKRNKSVEKLNTLKEYRNYLRDVGQWVRETEYNIRAKATSNSQQLTSYLDQIMQEQKQGVDAGYETAGNFQQAMMRGNEQMAYNNAMGVNPANYDLYGGITGKVKQPEDDLYSLYE